MKFKEKSQREYIFDKDLRIGCVSIRGIDFGEEYEKISAFYDKLTAAYIEFAQKRIPEYYKKFGKDINCVLLINLFYSNDKFLSVRYEARMYAGNELFFKKSFSNVWRLPKCRLYYKRRLLYRCRGVEYNGKELYFFNY